MLRQAEFTRSARRPVVTLGAADGPGDVTGGAARGNRPLQGQPGDRRLDALLRAIEAIVTRGEAGAGLVTCLTDITASGDHSRLIIRGQKAAAAWIASLPC